MTKNPKQSVKQKLVLQEDKDQQTLSQINQKERKDPY